MPPSARHAWFSVGVRLVTRNRGHRIETSGKDGDEERLLVPWSAMSGLTFPSATVPQNVFRSLKRGIDCLRVGVAAVGDGEVRRKRARAGAGGAVESNNIVRGRGGVSIGRFNDCRARVFCGVVRVRLTCGVFSPRWGVGLDIGVW